MAFTCGGAANKNDIIQLYVEKRKSASKAKIKLDGTYEKSKAKNTITK